MLVMVRLLRLVFYTRKLDGRCGLKEDGGHCGLADRAENVALLVCVMSYDFAGRFGWAN